MVSLLPLSPHPSSPDVRPRLSRRAFAALRIRPRLEDSCQNIGNYMARQASAADGAAQSPVFAGPVAARPPWRRFLWDLHTPDRPPSVLCYVNNFELLSDRTLYFFFKARVSGCATLIRAANALTGTANIT